jgi:hypothetical protein
LGNRVLCPGSVGSPRSWSSRSAAAPDCWMSLTSPVSGLMLAPATARAVSDTMKMA